MRRKIRRVKPGDIIKSKVFDGKLEDNARSYRIEFWEVKKVFPNLVLAERHGLRECFDYGWLLVNGYEG